VGKQAAPTDTSAATDGALTSTVAATAPVAPKVSAKAAVTAQAGTTASAASDTASGKADPSATTAATPAVAAKQATADAAANAATADASSAPSTSAAAATHGHSATAETAHTPTDSTDATLQATGTVQPQIQTAATTIPVGPLTVTAATNGTVPLSGLALEIAASAKNGKSSFEIRLDPADLGRIDVRIDVDRNGQMTSHLTVEKPETLSMLQQDAPQLQRALDNAGFKTGDGGLQFSLRDQSSSGQNSGNQSGSNAQRLVISDDDTVPAVLAGRTYGRSLGSSSGVDISV
jgi:flagellar hook-length control protein FliK